MQPELARTPPRMALTHAQTRSLTQVLTETYPRPAAFTELEVGLGAPVQLDPGLAPEDRALFLVTWAEEEDDRIHALLVRLAGAAPSTGAAVVLRVQQERHPDWAAPELIRWLAEYVPSVDAIRARVGPALRLDPTLPPFKGTRLRTVLVGGCRGDTPFDASLCGGTHLPSLDQIGTLRRLQVGYDAELSLWRCSFRLDDRRA